MSEIIETKTVIFEKKYNVKIEDFATTTQINDFIEKQENKKLDIIDTIQKI